MSKVVVVGSGAREHALSWRLSREAEVFVVGGNAGTANVAKEIDCAPDDAKSIAAAKPDLVVVGPEAPLCAGLADRLRALGIDVFGPSEAAAKLEGSKVFAKSVMKRASVPTAEAHSFVDAGRALAFVRSSKTPWVVKADGLAGGKGVTVAADIDETCSAISACLESRAFGVAGAELLLEEVLVGEEVSYHVLCDGERYVALGAAQDHKRAFDGDRGPNTGGMGAYGPPPAFTRAIEAQVKREVVEPTLREMAREGAPFRGVLFVGLMLTASGPKVLEFNVRFGDPETAVLMTRLEGNAFSLLSACATGRLDREPAITMGAPHALTVVLASGGYPRAYEKGKVIKGLKDAARLAGVQVFHAGTRREGEEVVTAGGRVLAVTATGDTLTQAHERAYQAVDRIDFEGKHVRRDIGHHAL